VCTRDRRRWTFAVQEACDDVYCSPFDMDAQARLRDLLLRERPAIGNAVRLDDLSPARTTATETRAWVRTLRIACDELHDGPENTDAQRRLLELLSEPARQG